MSIVSDVFSNIATSVTFSSCLSAFCNTSTLPNNPYPTALARLILNCSSVSSSTPITNGLLGLLMLAMSKYTLFILVIVLGVTCTSPDSFALKLRVTVVLAGIV